MGFITYLEVKYEKCQKAGGEKVETFYCKILWPKSTDF